MWEDFIHQKVHLRRSWWGKWVKGRFLVCYCQVFKSHCNFNLCSCIRVVSRIMLSLIKYLCIWVLMWDTYNYLTTSVNTLTSKEVCLSDKLFFDHKKWLSIQKINLFALLKPNNHILHLWTQFSPCQPGSVILILISSCSSWPFCLHNPLSQSFFLQSSIILTWIYPNFELDVNSRAIAAPQGRSLVGAQLLNKEVVIIISGVVLHKVSIEHVVLRASATIATANSATEKLRFLFWAGTVCTLTNNDA